MLERDIVKQIMNYLKKLDNSYFIKTHGHAYQRAGVPDIVGCYCGYFIGLEVKQPGKYPTELQKDVQQRLRDAWGISEIVYSVNDVEKIISAVDNKIKR